MRANVSAMRPRAATGYFAVRADPAFAAELDGLLATCLQHEVDHLNGVLFIDHISKLKRDMVVRKFTKLAKSRVSGAAM